MKAAQGIPTLRRLNFYISRGVVTYDCNEQLKIQYNYEQIRKSSQEHKGYAH